MVIYNVRNENSSWIEKNLAELCLRYINGELLERSFGKSVRILLSRIDGESSVNINLVRKRIEYGLRHKCDKAFQQGRNLSDWNDEATFDKLDLSYTHDSQESSPLEVQIMVTQKEERACRIALTQQVDEIKKQMEKLVAASSSCTEQSLTSLPQPSPMEYSPIPFKNIPIIDMSLPLTEVASLVGQACREVGFMYVVNHGVSSRRMAHTFNLAKKFFELPMDVKKQVLATRSRSGIRGYFCIGEENLHGKGGTTQDLAESTSTVGDFKEGFDCGREIDFLDPDLACSLVDFNQWLEEKELPGFQQGVMDYQKAVLSVGRNLLKAFAVGLGLPQNYFNLRARKPMVTLRLLHYPPQEESKDRVNQIGCGAHTDYGYCTILNQDAVGGLQIRNSSGEWIDAPSVSNSFVINLGDMMSRWTNDVYTSTVHRVINLSAKDRYSIPFFLNPDVGTNVECLKTCVQAPNVAKYPPITSDEILLQRYSEAFEHIKN